MKEGKKLERLNLFVSFRSNRFNMGVLIGSIALTTCLFFHYSVFAGILLFIIFTIVGIFKLTVPQKYNKYIGSFILLCSATINVVLMQLIMNESLLSIGVIKIILNIISVLLVLLSIFIILPNIQLTCCIGTFLFLLFAIVNNYVNSYRGGELTVLDLVSIRTAINVIDSYIFELTPTIAYAVLLGIWAIFSFYVCPTIIFRGIRTRVLTLVSIIIATWIFLVGSSDFHSAQAQYIRGGSELNGCFLNFVLSGKEVVFTKPTGYDLRTIADLEKEYTTVSLGERKKPTIIVIMDESFVDLSVLGSKVNTNISVTPFLDSIHENVIKGYALTSVFGGNTPNSEFEFLTGNSMAFLPKSAIPYQQYISQETSSILSELKEKNYTCEVTHPFDSTGWMRPRVYSFLQFDQYTFIEDYPQKNLLRDFVSDQEMFEYIVQKYEERNPKIGFFLFGVTIQNHGGYLYKGDNYKDSVLLNGYSKEYFDVEQYLSVIHETDSALEYLLTYFNDKEDPIVIVFFGDHFPALNQNFYEEVHGGPFDNLEDYLLQYKIPFFIWANYDIEEKYVNLTSLNYLSNYMFEASGMELPAYNQFLKDVEEVIPAINALGFYSKSDECFKTFQEANEEEKYWLNLYEQLQYNCLFDKENRSEVFFPIPDGE